MDAVEFLKEKSRMCNTFNLCDGGGYKETCELYKEGLTCADYTNDYPEKAVEIVERWAKEHPRKTRQERFLEMFPHADVRGGVLEACPGDIDMRYTCHEPKCCEDCKKEYWLAEVGE